VETGLERRHLLGISELSPEEIAHVLDTAETFREINAREIKKVPTLRGRTLVNLFFEPSTRTRTSFEIAGKRLSADTINISSSTSSVTKGETLLDTARNLEAMSPDFIVIRHPSAGAPHALARICRAAVVNAGDGAHEHPTQALLDALTIRQRKGRIEGLEVAILGDVLHSRVARSNTHLLTKLGARVRLAGPGTLAPPEFVSLVESGDVKIANRVEEAVESADVVVVLRIQRERQSSAFLPSLREYAVHYGLNLKRLSAAKPDAIVMHPGPMNRGIEIASDVADGTRSLILDQVANGLAVRMAVLYLLAGGSLLAQHGDERARPEQQTQDAGASNENPTGESTHVIRHAEPGDAAARSTPPETDGGAQSALEFETVVTGGADSRGRRSRPNRPKLPATTANTQPAAEPVTTDN
jgi:aspartate carbamoyltransferase catalytic subunit